MNKLHRPKSSERTRESLIAAGTELFSRSGFEGTRVDLIARKARVNKAMINYHFGGKAGLYRTILVSLFTATLEKVQPLRTSSEPADVLLRSFVRDFSEMLARSPGLSTMLIREALTGGRHLDRATLRCYVSVFAIVREILEKGIREGTFRPVDPLLTHLSLIGSLVFFFATASMRERLIREGYVPIKAPEGEDYVAHVQDLMTRSLAADPAPGASKKRTT